MNGSPLPVNEDAGGTASVNPGFGNSGLPFDFQLYGSPLGGFNTSATNDTILNAGRNAPVIFIPSVPGITPLTPSRSSNCSRYNTFDQKYQYEVVG